MRIRLSLLAMVLAMILPARAFCDTSAAPARVVLPGSKLELRLQTSAAMAYVLDVTIDPAIERASLPAFGAGGGMGVEVAGPAWVYATASASYAFSTASLYDDYGFRYRGIEDWRLALSTGPRVRLDWAELDILAGLALAASRYLDTSLASAALVPTLEARLLFALPNTFLPGLALQVGAPVEVAIRGSALGISTGLSVGLSAPLPVKGGKR